jgi:hypothetical protein
MNLISKNHGWQDEYNEFQTHYSLNYLSHKKYQKKYLKLKN